MDPNIPNDESTAPASGVKRLWLHAIVVLFTGVLIFVLGLLTLGMAWQQRNEYHAATALIWMLDGAVWSVLALYCFRHHPRALLLLLASGTLLLAATGMRFESTALLLAGLQETLPTFQRYPIAALLALLCCMFAAVVRLLYTPAPAAARPLTTPQLAGIAGGLLLIHALPLAVLPGRVRQAAHDEVFALVERYPVQAEQKVTLGGVSSLVLGATLQAPYIEQSRAEEALAGFNAELDAIKASGSTWISVEIRQDALPMDASPDFQFVRTYAERARREGLKVMLVQAPASAATAQQMNWHKFTVAQRERINFFVEKIQPDALLLCGSPLEYLRQNNVVNPRRDDMRVTGQAQHRTNIDLFLDLWAQQFSGALNDAKKLCPTMGTGVALQPAVNEDQEIYRRLCNTRGIDFFAIELFNRAQMQAFLTLVDRYKHPHEHGKQCWIYECYNGIPLIGPRDVEADAAWLAVCVGWAQMQRIDGVFVKAYGALIPEGSLHSLASLKLAQQWRDARQALSPVGERWKSLSKLCGKGRPEAAEAPAVAPK